MADLLTTEALATWTGKDPGDVATDPYAVDVIVQVSDYLCFLGGHPLWTYAPGANQAPIDVRMLALKVIRRTYVNPDQVVAEGNLGPIGGDRVADHAALAFELTDAERKIVAKYNADGDPEVGGQIWIQPTYTGTDLATEEVTLFVGDDQQVALADSADPREWKIPLFSPGDPGGV
jgi:hypothetical protein